MVRKRRLMCALREGVQVSEVGHRRDMRHRTCAYEGRDPRSCKIVSY
jgi:hypothetical protein